MLIPSFIYKTFGLGKVEEFAQFTGLVVGRLKLPLKSDWRARFLGLVCFHPQVWKRKPRQITICHPCCLKKGQDQVKISTAQLLDASFSARFTTLHTLTV